jgi:EAL domain-containing protein (putative c-di-GMP-specific phosphodiesterase class I)
MKKWHDKGYNNLKISVNISGIQLLQSNLLNQVESILKASKLEPKFLELELTESILMENIERASSLLEEFRQRGIHISIDDFGTGYSSLNYLKRLPIDTLKIDQSFIRNIQKDKNDKIIVNTIIAMAHGLEFSVIAEGVENSYQRDYLKEMGCDIFQGYHFGRPLSADTFEQLLEQNDHLSGTNEKLEKLDYDLVQALEKYSKPLNI